MKLHDLQSPAGTVHRRKRVGRGTGSGRWQDINQRSQRAESPLGEWVRPGFEGGQMPLQKKDTQARIHQYI